MAAEQSKLIASGNKLDSGRIALSSDWTDNLSRISDG
jgi:hypothetical protein